MKNLKLGVFCLGLAVAMAGAVSVIAAQDRDGAELGARAGVVVDGVNPDSPAEKAGIKAGDIVVDYDGERVRSAQQFHVPEMPNFNFGVTKESAAARAGIKAGDVIVSINGKAVSDADDLTSALEGINGDDRRASRQERDDAEGNAQFSVRSRVTSWVSAAASMGFVK